MTTEIQEHCAICYEVIDCTNRTGTTEEILKYLKLLNTNINSLLLQQALICDNCLVKIKSACKFKTSYLELQQIYSNTKTDEERYSEKHVVCEICKSTVNAKDTMSLFDPVVKINKLMLVNYLSSELETKINDDPQTCESCHKSMLTFCNITNLLSIFDQDTCELYPKQQINGHDNELSCVIAKEEPQLDSHLNSTNSSEHSSIKIKEETLDMINEQRNVEYNEFLVKNEELDLKMDCEEETTDERTEPQCQEPEKNLSLLFYKKLFIQIELDNGLTIKPVNCDDTFHCTMCDFKTKDTSCLKPHILIHMPPVEKEIFRCETCEFKSEYKKSLQYHMLSHKNPDEVKLFRCRICQLIIKRKDKLKAHMLLHKKPDEIEMLHISAKFNDYLTKHKMIHKKPGQMKLISLSKRALIRRRRRKHTCPYCDIPVLNFARHLERQHSNQVDVQRYMHLNKNDPIRKKFIDKIRKEGDFSSGQQILVQDKLKHPITPSNHLLPCIHCKGYYAKNTLRRHVVRCFFNNDDKSDLRRRHQSDSQTLLAGYFEPDDPLRTSGVLRSLIADEISLVAKQDDIICEVGRMYVKSHDQKHMLAIAKRYMRRLARLLIEVRKKENDHSLSFYSLLHPSKFQTIVSALKALTNYDREKNVFSSPSLALQMGTLIRKAITAAYSLEVQKDANSPNLIVLRTMRTLMENEWSTEIPSEARQNSENVGSPKITSADEDLTNLKRKEETVETDKPELRAEIPDSKCEKKKRTVRKWTLEEKNITEEYFKRHIKEGIVPKKGEVDKLVSLFPKIFNDRKWDSIKVYVYNQYTKNQ